MGKERKSSKREEMGSPNCTIKGDTVVVGILGKVRGSVNVPADERPAKHLSHGWLEHGVELHLLHHRNRILTHRQIQTSTHS